MNTRPLLEEFFDRELIDVSQFADVFDIVGQDVRDTLVADPERYPTPLRFGGRPYWPWAQLMAWVRAGEPRGFNLPATDFVPAAVSRFADSNLEKVTT